MSTGKKNMRQFLAVVIGIIATVCVGKVTGGFLRESAAQRIDHAPSAVVPVADQISPIIAVITIQDPEGITEADLDLEGLKRLEQYMVQTTLQRARANYAKQGFDPKTYNPKVDAGSVYMVVGGKKLAILKMNIDNQIRAVWIMGFNRGQLLRVTCIRGSNHEIPVFSGDCGQKVTEAFGSSGTPQAR